MNSNPQYLAFDFGAESGRAVLGTLRDGRLDMAEIHRFPNTPRFVGGRLCWDVRYLFAELKKGLALAVAKSGGALSTIGVDTWGVDFALLDSSGELLSDPVHYRDARTNGIFERAFEIVPRREIFEETGIQFLQFNTLFQLFSLRLEGSTFLDSASRLLMMPDLFNFWLTGCAAQEYTDATTTQCYDPRARDWAWPLLDAFNIPRHLFHGVTPPGTILGELLPEVARETGASHLRVALPATHDTGSAVVAIPVRSKSWAYISCGTWSLVGAETKEPIINNLALASNFTNEGGAFGTNRLLCNVMGLWLLQQAREGWRRAGKEWNYDEVIRAAFDASRFAAWIDPDDSSFLNPPDMNVAIAAFCAKTGQRPPESIGATARCIMESLAMKYRMKIEIIGALVGKQIEQIHIVGGGSRNTMLCQFTADACNRPVLAGPAEATAMGNLLVQAAADGQIIGLGEARAIVRASSQIVEYLPHESQLWEAPYCRFRRSIE